MGKETIMLATSNKAKTEQAQFQAGQETTLILGVPLFDEAKIKREIADISEEQGIAYAIAVSRQKLLVQRDRLRLEEGEETDYTIITSDSSLVFKKDGNFQVLDRDSSFEEKRNALREINKQKELMFIGAVSFGRKKGTAVWTALSYCNIPLNRELTMDDLPIKTDELSALVPEGQKTQAGYLSFSDSNLEQPATQETLASEDFSAVKPYISGLTKEIIQFAERTSLMDRKIGPILAHLVEKYPWNTILFYHLTRGFDAVQLRQFYDNLVDDYETTFNLMGGNCSLFTLKLGELLSADFSPKVIIYPSMIEDDLVGHSAIFIQENEIGYLLEPALGIPFPIPVHQKIPLAPFRLGNKLILVNVSDRNIDALPDLQIAGRVRPLLAQGTMNLNLFRKLLPMILFDLHGKRQEGKINYAGRDGHNMLGISVDLKRKTIKIRAKHLRFDGGLLDFLKSKEKNELVSFCQKEGIDWQIILDQLNFLNL